MSRLFAGTPLERPITCEHCHQPHATCTCPRNTQGKVVRPQDQHPRVRREKSRGKVVTIIAGLEARPADLEPILKTLRTTLGCGGTLTQDNELELQGDHRDKVLAWLIEKGYKAKAAGG